MTMDQLRRDNACIERRYHRAEKSGDMREIYAARADYQANVEKQKDELSKMDKSSQEYKDAKESIDQQEVTGRKMGYYVKDTDNMGRISDKMDQLEYENRDLSHQMDRAVAKGDTRKYDELSQRYSTNVRAQEGMASELKMNGIERDNTIERQKIEKRNLDFDMRDKMEEKIAQAESKGKQPSERDLADREKYGKLGREGERQALEELDNRKLKEMESSFGISQADIEKERQNMEKSRDRLLSEEKQR